MVGYVPPSASELNQAVSNVKTKYTNTTRAKVVSFLESTQKFISETPWDAKIFPAEELHDASLGLWLLCREGIPKGATWWDGYHFFSPEFRKGYLFNSGSTLYTILSDELRIDKKTNPLDEKITLKYLVKFYNLIFNEDPSIQEILAPLKNDLASKGIKLEKIKLHLESLMSEIFYAMPGDINKLLHAIPTDKAMHGKMSNFKEQYAENKKIQREKQTRLFRIFNTKNEEREFTAQMAQAISEELPPDDKGENLSRNQRKRMGMLLYIMESINNHSWPFLSPESRSELYKLCKDALDNELKNFPEYTELECLTTFRNYINEASVRDSLEDYGKKVFGKENRLQSDHQLDLLVADLNKIIDKIATKHLNKTNWPAARFLGSLGALILAAPFFGVGSLIGLTVSESNPMVRPKVQSGNVLNTLGTTTMGLSHNYLCLMASSFIFQSGLMRAFGKLFEAGGMLIGYGVFGTAGLLVDLSYKGFRNLCLYHIYMYENHYDPVLMKNVDIDFFKTCLLLPPCVITDGDQKHLVKLANENFENEVLTNIKPLRP